MAHQQEVRTKRGASGRPRRWPSPGAAIFPVVLLFFATYFLGGEIGFWSDDYWHNQRDPVTQALPGKISDLLIDRGFFLRPLFYFFVPLITTLTWKAEWLAHLIMVAAHGVVVVLLWRLMLRLRLARPAAGAAALLYMVYPIQFEAVMWVSALPTAMATVLMLSIYHLYASHAKGIGWTGSWWLAWQFPLLAFAVCSLNEQPAAGILVMPALYIVGAIGSERARGRTLLQHGLRCLLPPLLAGSAVLLYVYFVKRGSAPLGITPAPAGIRGSADTLVRPEQLPSRVVEFARTLWPRIWMKNFFAGAFRQGVSELRSAGPASILWLAVLAPAALLWLVRWVRLEPGLISPARRSLGVGLAAAVFGLALYIVGFIPPMLVVVYVADSRLMYWPSIGAAFVVAGVGTMLASIAGGRAYAARTAVGAVLLPVLIGWSVAYIGIQGAFRNRWDMDHDEGRQLRALLPDPAPLTFFIPVRVESAAAHTGSPVFDVHHRSVWEFPWTVPKFIMTVYQREDVRCGYWRSWLTNSPVKGADERGVHFAERLGPRFERIEGSGSRVIWERAVPFVVGADGLVRLVTHVVVQEPGKMEVVVEVPQARGRGLPRLEIRVPRA
jgi:hypothetical protein